MNELCENMSESLCLPVVIFQEMILNSFTLSGESVLLHLKRIKTVL